MNASELLDLAAIVSAQGPVLVEGPGSLSTSGLEQYWTASQCRFDRWSKTFKEFGARADRAGDSSGPEDASPVFLATLEEVLAGEVLTRVFGAVVTAYDARRKSDQAEPIARSIMIGHLEARNRVLRFLVGGQGIDAEEAFRLNRLRRRTERWSDMLVGYLHDLIDVDQFAVDPQRALDFAEDLSYRRRLPGGRQVWPLLQASLRATFGSGLSAASPNAELNERIASAVLSCFRSELFDSTGTLHSLWVTRLCNGADDVDGMIEDLLYHGPTDDEGHDDAQSADQFLDRIRRFNRS
ncbi:MAG TPA: hypothetical protein VJL29_13515 [Thermoguttaceae bacterium]|nr:hypothetical protein [Thermoguttaceae bacterium]